MRLRRLASTMLVCCLALSQAASVGGYDNTRNNKSPEASRTPQLLTQEQMKQRESRAKVIASVTSQLLDHNVPFDPSILFVNGWREQLARALSSMPEARWIESTPARWVAWLLQTSLSCQIESTSLRTP